MIKAANFKVGTNMKPSMTEKYFEMQVIHRMAALLKVEVPKNLHFNDYLQLFKQK